MRHALPVLVFLAWAAPANAASFAIHGYHSVPPYPASHGCVRIPMWIAPSVFASRDYGEPVFIYH